jgi:amino acid permease
LLLSILMSLIIEPVNGTSVGGGGGDDDDEKTVLLVSDRKERKEELTMVSLPVAWAFTIAYIIGVGVLGIPYAFYQGGIILSLLLLGISSFVSYCSIIWIIECQARARALLNFGAVTGVAVRRDDSVDASAFFSASSFSSSIDESDEDEAIDLLSSVGAINGDEYERKEESKKIDGDGDGGGDGDRNDDDGGGLSASRLLDKEADRKFFGQSRYRVTASVKYEMNQLCALMLGRWGKVSYEISLAIYTWGALWSYSAVFANSLTTYVPIVGMTTAGGCDMDVSDVPSECSNAYYIWMAIFAAIVLPLSCLEITEQRHLQVALCIFRFVALCTMIASIYVAMFSVPFKSYSITERAPYVATERLVHWPGFGLAFTTSVFAQLVHHSIPGLSSPLRRKSNLRLLFASALTTTFIFYSILGVLCALYFGPGTNQVVTLNWTTYSAPGFDRSNGAWPSKILSYIVVLFPVADILSAMPLMAVTLGNNFFFGLPDEWTEHGTRAWVKIVCRLCAVVPPIILGLALHSLSTIISYTGTAGFFLAFIFPAALQLRSVALTKRAFTNWRTPFSWHFSHVAYAWVVLVAASLGFVFMIVELAIGPEYGF